MFGLWFVNVSLGVAVLATSALAADGPAVAVKGAAPAVCYFTPAQSGPASNMTLGSASASLADLLINQLIDPATAQLQPASISLSLNGICNNAHTFAIQSNGGGLQTSAARRPAFPTTWITAQACCGVEPAAACRHPAPPGSPRRSLLCRGRLPGRYSCKSSLRPAAPTGFRCSPALTPTPSP